jgi:hypothetical protein
MVINELFSDRHMGKSVEDSFSTEEMGGERMKIPEEIKLVMYFAVALGLLGCFECFGKPAFLDVFIVYKCF